MRLVSLELVLSALCVVLASAQVRAVSQTSTATLLLSLSAELATATEPRVALQLQGNFPPAPAPGPEALTLAAAGLPANQVRAGPVNPVSTPLLTALVPIAGDIRADVTTGAKQVESGIGEVKGDWPAIEASFTGRKLLALSVQVCTASYTSTQLPKMPAGNACTLAHSSALLVSALCCIGLCCKHMVQSCLQQSDKACMGG